MADLITLRGKYWYASCSYMKQQLRDSLKTPDKQIAIERLQELFLMVREDRYRFYKSKFDDLVKKYNPQSDRENKLRNLRIHLIPEFSGKRLHEINVQEWAEKIAAKFTKSTALHIMRPATGMGLEINYKDIIFKEGKKFDGTQILSETLALEILEKLKSGSRTRKYHGICHVAMYSTMPLADLLHLTKDQVILKGEDAGITYTRRKTRHLDKPPIVVPMMNKLREAFKGVPTPLADDGLWFPNMNNTTISSIVGRAFRACGWVHGRAMHNFRHFGACYLIKQGVALTTIQELMGHSDFNTTLIYARTDRETLKEAMRKFDVGK